MFTKSDVQLAWFAHRVALDAEANQLPDQSFNKAASESLRQLALGETDEERQAHLANLQAEYELGRAILAQAHLAVGNRRQRGATSPEPLVSPDAPTIQVDAGHLVIAEAVRDVTLMTNAADNWMTPAEVAEAIGTSESNWRNKAAAGLIPGAVKKGKQWLLPRSVLRARGVEV